MEQKSIMVRVDHETHEKVKLLAKKDRRSMGNFIAKLVEEKIKSKGCLISKTDIN